jgi:hypothetical protein
MERQEGILIGVLRKGLACRRMGLHKPRLVLKDGFDQLVDQIVGEISSPDCKIVHSEGDIVLIQSDVGSRRYLRGTELRHRLADGVNLLGRQTDESDRLLRLRLETAYRTLETAHA